MPGVRMMQVGGEWLDYSPRVSLRPGDVRGSAAELGEPTLPAEPDAYNLIVPSGIGDMAWMAPKLVALGERTGRAVRLSCPAGLPHRLHQLVERIHGLEFAGYEPGVTTRQLFDRRLIDGRPSTDLPLGRWRCLSANTWLETRHRIESFLPDLPHRFHWPELIRIDADEKRRAAELAKSLPKQYVVLYGSNRGKCRLTNEAWHLWRTENEWVEVIEACREIIPGCGFATVGAEWDDREEDFAAIVTALEVMRRSAAGFYFNSGLGFLCDVLEAPCFMLMPKDAAHHSLCWTVTDPESKTWKAVSGPTAAQGIEWLARVVSKAHQAPTSRNAGAPATSESQSRPRGSTRQESRSGHHA